MSETLKQPFSTAPKTTFQFANQTTNGMVHMSFLTLGDSINLQFPLSQVDTMIENLHRVKQVMIQNGWNKS